MINTIYATQHKYFQLSSSPDFTETTNCCAHQPPPPEPSTIDTTNQQDTHQSTNSSPGHLISVAKVFCSICDTEEDAYWCFDQFLKLPLKQYSSWVCIYDVLACMWPANLSALTDNRYLFANKYIIKNIRST